MKEHLKNQSIQVWPESKLIIAEGTYTVCGPDGKANAVLLGTSKQQRSTATLYAAAPDLLAACKLALKALNEYQPNCFENYELNAAIIKAEAKDR